jgi:hypothetical protein
MAATEQALVDVLGMGEPKKMTVHNVYKFEEGGTAIRVDWIGAGPDDTEDDCFWVRLCIADDPPFGNSQAIEFLHGSEIMANLGRALCEAASKVDQAEISDLGDFLHEAFKKERDRERQDREPLWRRLARCFAKDGKR